MYVKSISQVAANYRSRAVKCVNARVEDGLGGGRVCRDEKHSVQAKERVIQVGGQRYSAPCDWEVK